MSIWPTTPLLLSLVLAILPAGLVHADSGPALQVIYDIRPPLTVREGNSLGGSIGAAGVQALQLAGIPHVLQEVPVRRQLSMVENSKQAVCALGRIRTAERERLGWFSEALGQSRGYVAIVRQGEPLPRPPSLTLWAAEPRLRWGVQAGLHYSDQIDRLRNTAKAAVSTFNANHQHFADLLMSRRIDFVILQADEATEVMRRSNNIGQQLRQIELADLRDVEQRYFYCSKSVPEATRTALNQAITRLRKPPQAPAQAPRVKP
jgi:Bacterial extracellular solute-binding proteins, family 3